jgi:hypothetical protein
LRGPDAGRSRSAFNSGRAGVALISRAQSRIRLEVSAVNHPCHDKVAEYRRQVQEIRTAVEKISITEAREQLLETAEHLEALAREEERKARRGTLTVRLRFHRRSQELTCQCLV